MPISITGLDQLIATLHNAPEEIRPIIRKGLRAGGKVVQAAMVERAPKTQSSLRYGSPNWRTRQRHRHQARPVRQAAHWRDSNDHRSRPQVARIPPRPCVVRVYPLITGGKSRKQKRDQGSIAVRVSTSAMYPRTRWLRPAFETSESAAEEAITSSIAGDITNKYGK